MPRASVGVVVLLGLIVTGCASGAGECPSDWARAEGTSCSVDAKVCGLDTCASCEACSTLRCIAGTWRRVEGPASGECAASAYGRDTVGGDAFEADAGESSGTNTGSVSLTPVACEGSPYVVAGERCALEGDACGLDRCTDPCATCRYSECRQGTWVLLRVEPSSSCNPADGEVAFDWQCDALEGGVTPICGDPNVHPCFPSCQAGAVACAPSDRSKGDGPPWAVYTCNGSCFEGRDCPEGDSCVDASPHAAACVSDLTSCEEAEALFAALLDIVRVCWGPFDCQPKEIPCGPGSSGGWFAVNPEFYDWRGQGLPALGERLVELACASEPCPSGSAPKAMECVDGLCVFVGE